MNKNRGFIFAALLVTTTLACALPAQPTASVSQPTPDTRVGTMVAGTVSAALDLTATASVPTSTPLPTSTPTPTATPVESGAGSSLTKQDDGSTLFVDERAGYRITIPDGWLAVRVNEQEYLDAFLLPQAANDRVQAALLGIQTQNPAVLRLLAVDVIEGHIQNETVTNVNFIWDAQTDVSFETEDDLQRIAADLPGTVDGLTVTSVDFVIPTRGDIYGVIESEIGGFNALDEQVTLVQKMAIFNLKTGTLVVTFTTDGDFTETTLPFFSAMLETLVIDSE
jgi:hypothetical protein